MKKVILPLLAAVATMVLLFWIGATFDLSLLDFSLVLHSPDDGGFNFNVDIALLPITLGLITGFTLERQL